jgi:HK97 family phage prohead protease
MKRERRFLTEDVVLDTTQQEAPKISGYAAKFGVLSEDLGGFKERIDASAFDKCLKASPDICGTQNHDANFLLGRTTSGTMNVVADRIGLRYEIDPPDTTYARDLLVSLRRKDITKSSFGFICRKDKWTEENGQVIRTLLEVDCFDAGPVTYAAYSDATAQVRSLFPDAKGELPSEIKERIAEVRTGGGMVERRYHRVTSAIAGAKWAILPEKLETICALIDARANGQEATKEEIRAALQAAHSDAPTETGTVAVIPVYGTISQRMSMFDEFSGGTSCEAISNQLRTALADESVSSIVFDIDSPGGTVTGVPELAAEIIAARGTKPIIAVANGMAASAAYWIASAADKIVVTPSGEVGSVGVYCTHQDVSGAMDKAGVKITFIKAGTYKAEGNPYGPLSESTEAYIQDGVDKFYDMFTSAVAQGRGVTQDEVLAKFGQGRMVMAKDAVAAGMVDEIATLDQVLAGLASVNVPTVAVSDGPKDITAQADSKVAVGEDDPETCMCDCDECMDGDCEDCSNDDCEDPICDCGDGDDLGDDDGLGQASKVSVEAEDKGVEAFNYRSRLIKMQELLNR